MMESNNDALYSHALKSLSKLTEFQKSSLPSRFGKTQIECIPYLYYENGKYVYDCCERGLRVMHRITTNIHEALYWVYDDIIHELGFSYELKNRNPLQDTRRIAFKKMDELFSIIGEPYHSMWKKEFEAIIAVAPFDDEIHKILYLVDEYEKMVKALRSVTQDMSPVGQEAAILILKTHFYSSTDGMKNPLQSVRQMRNAILIIRDNLQNSHISSSPIALTFIQSVFNTEAIAAQVKDLEQ